MAGNGSSKWMERIEDEDRMFIKRFVLASGSLKKMAKAYGVYDRESGSAKRALFVVDGAGRIHWSHVAPAGVNPGADGILNALESL